MGVDNIDGLLLTCIQLLDIDPASPVTFDAKADLTGHFDGLPAGRTHNVVINTEKDYFVAVGAQPRNSTCLAVS